MYLVSRCLILPQPSRCEMALAATASQKILIFTSMPHSPSKAFKNNAFAAVDTST
jgi:hypothetical protein